MCVLVGHRCVEAAFLGFSVVCVGMFVFVAALQVRIGSWVCLNNSPAVHGSCPLGVRSKWQRHDSMRIGSDCLSPGVLSPDLVVMSFVS